MSKVSLKDISIKSDNENVLQYKRPEDTCYSDRGNGLVVFNTNTNRYELRGVIILCHGPTNLIDYFDVTRIFPWIQRQISIT